MVACSDASGQVLAREGTGALAAVGRTVAPSGPEERGLIGALTISVNAAGTLRTLVQSRALGARVLLVQELRLGAG